MKIPIYSVSERRPPVNEEILKINVDDDGYIDTIIKAEASIAVPDDPEEEALIPPGTVKDLVWSLEGTSEDMWLDDMWAFIQVKQGE